VVSYHGSDLHGKGWLFKLSQAIARRAAANICVTGEQGLRLGTHHEVISYGIDLERFRASAEKKQTPGPLDPKEKPFCFCYVGYLIPLKRVEAIISAMAELPQNVILNIAGDGPCRDKLEAKVAQLGLRQRVTFLGSLPYHRVQEIFLDSDAHLLVSEREGRPNVILQAMACGIPSLASAVGGIPEQIVHGETGELLSPCLGDLSQRMKAWCEAPQELEAMGKKARLRLENMGIASAEIARKHGLLYNKLSSKGFTGL
jgi:glycosyltransferase involved in cell wall biosynthesis